MTAAEARELSRKRSEMLVQKDQQQYDELMEWIDEQISKEEVYKTRYFGNLSKRVMSRLAKEGYSIKISSYRNETAYDISWEEEEKEYPYEGYTGPSHHG